MVVTQAIESMPSSLFQRKRKHKQEHRHRNHFCAQRLNNEAASCIGSRQYDRAVAYLVKALCLSPTNNRSAVPDASTSSRCLLDECIAYSEERAVHGNTFHAKRIVGGCRTSKKRKINSKEFVDADNILSDDRKETRDVGYTHRKPIFITPKIINEGHVMGPTLSLIVTFNLALANHLKLLSSTESAPKNAATKRATKEKLGKVLKLYELAYKWEGEFSQRQRDSNRSDSNASGCDEKQETLKEQLQQTSATNASLIQPSEECNKFSSLRFDLIVCNNLSEIHRMAENYSKQEKCLQHLLSIVMFVVDWQRERDFNNDYNTDVEDYGDEQLERQQRQQEVSTNSDCTSSVGQLEVDAELSGEEQWEQRQQQQQLRRTGKRKRSSAFMDLDGFLHNITPFVLQKDCADAA